MAKLVKKIIENYIKHKKSTMLCIGPMSKNIIDSAIEVSNEIDIHLTLISSRRQIDSKEFGGGYVCNWDTFSYSNYIKKHDKKKKIILARDHGGPWQNTIEISNKLNKKKAIESAKLSFKNDIDAGFDIIHIDTSVTPFKNYKIHTILDMLFELYEYCVEYSRDNNKEILFEVGTEEQSASANTLELFEYSLNKIINFAEKNNYQKPTFAVAQTGTKVIEFENIGSFDNPIRVKKELPPELQIPIISNICNKTGIFLKEHNTDYLSDEALAWHPRLGINAANVAPEFGVLETKTIINVLKKNNLTVCMDKILKLSYDSKKWKKWLKIDTKLTDTEKSILSCHYIFSSKTYLELINEAKIELFKKNINLDVIVKEKIKKNILRYAYNFRMIGL